MTTTEASQVADEQAAAEPAAPVDPSIQAWDNWVKTFGAEVDEAAKDRCYIIHC